MSGILVHSCCAPCATASVESLVGEGESPYLYFHNPNIHPWTEFKARADAFKAYLAGTGLPGFVDETYGLMKFVSTAPALTRPARCEHCYRMRLSAAADKARQMGIGRFTTTLTISPYQDHELIRKVGEELAAARGIEFVYRDFRPLYRKSRSMSRQAGYYMQKYCGCVFSEAERYGAAEEAPK